MDEASQTRRELEDSRQEAVALRAQIERERLASKQSVKAAEIRGLETTRKLLEEARARQAAAEGRSAEFEKINISLRSELAGAEKRREEEHLAAASLRAQLEVALEQARDKSARLLESEAILSKVQDEGGARVRSLESQLDHERSQVDVHYEDGMNAGLEMIASMLEVAHPEWNIREELDVLINARLEAPSSSQLPPSPDLASTEPSDLGHVLPEVPTNLPAELPEAQSDLLVEPFETQSDPPAVVQENLGPPAGAQG